MRVTEGCESKCFQLILLYIDKDALLNPALYIASNVRWQN